MALRSYTALQLEAYFLGKNILSVFSNDTQLPIVRYLGCYTSGSFTASSQTYNLLQEYAEKDLWHYWTDVSTTPPFRTAEITRYWDSLFKIADAVREIHKRLRIGPSVKEFMSYQGYASRPLAQTKQSVLSPTFIGGMPTSSLKTFS